MFLLTMERQEDELNSEDLLIGQRKEDTERSDLELLEERINIYLPNFDPITLAEHQRQIYLRRFEIVKLQRTFKKWNKDSEIPTTKQALMDSLAKSTDQTWTALFRELHANEAKLVIPHLTAERSVLSPDLPSKLPAPWHEYLHTRVIAPYESAKDFLLNWGITPLSTDFKAYTVNESLDLFNSIWQAAEITFDEGTGLPIGLVEFYEDLDPEIKQILPPQFVIKARMVWDILHMHGTPQEHWSELDKEVKWYSIWLHFFSDYHQAADKVMYCIPPGGKFDDVTLFPDLVISVVPKIFESTGTKPRLVPGIIIENGVADAHFNNHKDSTKGLAETRMASTYSLSYFDINQTFCYGVVNGGRKMSVTLMKVFRNKGTPNDTRTYQATYIKNGDVVKPASETTDDKRNESPKNFTLEYSPANFKPIISLFVKIHFHLRTMREYKLRKDALSFSSTANTPGTKEVNALNRKTGQSQTPEPGQKDKAKSSSQSNTGTNYSGQANTRQQKLTLGKDTFDVVYLTPTTRSLVKDHMRRFVKVMPLGADGSLPLEYQILMKVDHPSILKPIDMIKYEETKECWVIFNNYCSNITPCRRCAYDNANMVLGVLDALHYLHSKGIVHADIKSGNVVATMRGTGCDRVTWSQDFKPFLVDFGLSFELDKNPKDCRGTYPFVAPEVYKGILSPAMDMWCFGYYVFDTFFGFHDITQESTFSEMWEIIEAKQESLPKYPIVELLFDLIWKCLEWEYEDRITAEQALKHPFFYAMKHIKPSYITRYVLGSMFNMDGEQPEDMTEEEKSVELPTDLPPTDHLEVLNDQEDVVQLEADSSYRASIDEDFNAPALKKRKTEEGRRVLADITNKQQ